MRADGSDAVVVLHLSQTAGRSPSTQSLHRANGRSKPKRMAVSLERCVLILISYSSAVLER